MSLLLRDCVGTHARVRSSSRVRAPLAPAPRESWGTVRSKHCHSHEPHRETPLWGEGNRPKRLGARPMAGGDSSLRQRSKLPRHDPPPRSCPRDPGPPSVPAGCWKAVGSPYQSSELMGVQPHCEDGNRLSGSLWVRLKRPQPTQSLSGSHFPLGLLRAGVGWQWQPRGPQNVNLCFDRGELSGESEPVLWA